jgi:hypothetical protein
VLVIGTDFSPQLHTTQLRESYFFSTAEQYSKKLEVPVRRRPNSNLFRRLEKIRRHYYLIEPVFFWEIFFWIGANDFENLVDKLL